MAAGLVAVVGCLGLVMSARGADADAPLPAGGESVFAGEVLTALRASGTAALGTATLVDLTNAPCACALRVTSLGQTPTPWTFQVMASVDRPIAKGDMLFVEFWLRAVEGQAETGEATSEFVLELRRTPNTKSIALPVAAGKEWRRYRAPFRALVNYPTGSAGIGFRAGYGRQTFELGGVRVLNFGRTVNFTDLPRTAITYDGIETNAAWRAAAAERIARLRMGDLTVRVREASGAPAADAAVSVQQQRHAFRFGSAVSARLLVDTTQADAARYQQAVTNLFNVVVMENDLKWGAWDDAAQRATTLRAIAWCRTNGVAVRGHCLVWPSWRFLPRGLAALTNRPSELRQRVLDHVREEVTATRGGTVEWDVINEPYANHDLMDILGRDAMVDWFREARAADPAPRLCLNDYASLVGGGLMTEHKRQFEATARWLKESGAPIGGLGLQCHFGMELTPPERLVRELDRLQAIGLPLTVTEWDISTPDEATQAAYTRDFLTAVFSHPAVEGVLTWGFWEGRHWKAEAALFRKDWTLKPNGAAWQQLVHEAWWTRANGHTDASGTLHVRAFLGTHRVTVRMPTGTRTVDVELPATGATAEITMPAVGQQ